MIGPNMALHCIFLRLGRVNGKSIGGFCNCRNCGCNFCRFDDGLFGDLVRLERDYKDNLPDT